MLSVVAQNFWLPSFSSLHNFYLNIPITISRKKKSLKKWNFRANTVIFVFSKTLQLHQTWFFSFIPLNLRNKNKTYIILGPYYIQAPLQFDFSLLRHFFIPTLLCLVWKSSLNIFLLETAINLSDAFFCRLFFTQTPSIYFSVNFYSLTRI